MVWRVAGLAGSLFEGERFGGFRAGKGVEIVEERVDELGAVHVRAESAERFRFAVPLRDECSKRGSIAAIPPIAHSISGPSRMRWIPASILGFHPNLGISDLPESRRRSESLVVRTLVEIFEDLVHQLLHIAIRPVDVDIVLESIQHGSAGVFGLVAIPLQRFREGVGLSAFDQ
jgi:hypothetical protein